MGVRVVVGLVALSLVAVGCGAHTPPPRSVSLRMRGAPPEATVTIDDVRVGPLNVVMARGVALSVGAHRVSVEAAGYLPWDRIVDARNSPVLLEVVLVPVPE